MSIYARILGTSQIVTAKPVKFAGLRDNIEKDNFPNLLAYLKVGDNLFFKLRVAEIFLEPHIRISFQTIECVHYSGLWITRIIFTDPHNSILSLHDDFSIALVPGDKFITNWNFNGESADELRHLQILD